MGEEMPGKKIVKRVIVLRDSKKGPKGSPYANLLSRMGHEYARLIGEKSLRGRGISRVFVSPWMRTTQTAIGLLEGAGDCTCEASPSVMNLTGVLMEEWIKHCDKGESIPEIAAAYPDFLNRARVIMWTEYQNIISYTERGGTSLVVTHSLCLEAAIYSLTRSVKDPKGTLINSVAECEGVVLAILEDGTVTIEEEIRHTT